MSAYALFFRDTQAAIKGQNPSATFGDVSKIVASMWDSLGEEQKQVSLCPFWDHPPRHCGPGASDRLGMSETRKTLLQRSFLDSVCPSVRWEAIRVLLFASGSH